MQETFGGDLEQSTLQLVLDQVEEVIVTFIEEIRERPTVAAALGAAIVGAILGSMLAGRRPRRRAVPADRIRAVGSVLKVSEYADLTALALRLLQNPLVRTYIRAAVA